MPDGLDCACGASCYGECDCGADWTCGGCAKLRKQLREMEALVKEAYLSGYALGHHHTVEGAVVCLEDQDDMYEDWKSDRGIKTKEY